MKRIAVIDLGTNTFHLLITDINGHIAPGNVCKKTIAVKLGQGGINQSIIHPDAFRRGIKAIEEFSDLINYHEVTEIKAVATAAIRSASNGKDFIAQIKTKTAIKIEMIDGEKEAELIFQGVRHAADLGSRSSLIMDIGGGSTEFIICDENDILWKKSYPIGAAKMMDRFHHSDPISQYDISQFNKHLEETLRDLMEQCERYRPTTLIGSAGAFETFAELISRRFESGKLIGSGPSKEIRLDHFREVAAILRASTHEQRTQMPGLIELRVDMIVIATILTDYVIHTLGIESMLLSDYSLKEGVLFDLLSKPSGSNTPE